jgi:hypothetical protein
MANEKENTKPAPEKAAASASPGVPKAPESKVTSSNDPGQKNVFNELFGDDALQKESHMMDSIVKQEDQKKKSFFGKRPGSKIPGLKKERNIRPNTTGHVLTQVGILLFFLVGVFAGTQNIARFSLIGNNPAERAIVTEAQALELTSESRVWQHLTGVLLLDEYMSLADEYFYNLSQSVSSYNSSNKRAEYKADAAELRPDLEELIGEIQGHLSETLKVDEVGSAGLVIDEWTAALRTKKDEVDESSLLQEIQDLESTRKMLSSTGFKSSLSDIDLDAVSDEDLELIFEKYSELSASVSSMISMIKSDRIDWSDALEDVEKWVKTVDPLFNTSFSGNLAVDSLRFVSTGEITLTGESSTDDTKNFTLVSNLIDLLNASELFEQAEERSYSKSSSDDSYNGSFRINMTLSNEE